MIPSFPEHHQWRSPRRELAWIPLVLVAFALASGEAEAQEGRNVVDGGCEACRIVLRDSIVLGDRDDPHSSAGIPEVSVDASGQFYLASRSLAGGSVIRYEPDGSFSGLLGGRGQGPGEFGVPWWVSVSGAGEVFVYDQARSAVQVFATDGTFLRGFSPVVPPLDPPVVIGDTVLAIVSASSRSQEAPDRPIQLYDTRTGVVLGGTGPKSDLRPDLPPSVRGVSSSTYPHVWILRTRLGGPVELWTIDGEKRYELAWERPDQYWQRKLGSTFGRQLVDSGSLGVSDLWEDDERGLLWTLHLLRNPDHVDPAVEPGQPMIGFFDPAIMNSRYSSIISVVDKASARALAHFPVDRYVRGFLEDGRIVAVGEDSEGFQWVSIWELAFTRP